MDFIVVAGYLLVAWFGLLGFELGSISLAALLFLLAPIK
jgi:hypothetical protein